MERVSDIVKRSGGLIGEAYGEGAYIKRSRYNIDTLKSDESKTSIEEAYNRKFKAQQEAEKQNIKIILTFGGAYSNHIAATSFAANEKGFNSIGIIRGVETLPLNDTLSFAKQNGMELHYVSRQEYRQKHSSDFIEKLKDNWSCNFK